MRNLAVFAIMVISFFSCSDDETVATLNETEKNDLLTLREEEKLARDVYLYTYDKYALDISLNISDSEQTHMNKVLDLLNKYNLEDPVLANRGKFTNQTLQTLYNDLTSQVDISLIEALKVGATIEDLDIKDIEDFENRTDKSDILNVYEKLKCGSRNHMRAYYSQLLTNNTIYLAQFITASELTEIVTTDNEQCGRN